MPEYKDLKERIDRGETIILDGAIGTQLQSMGAANDPYCWAAIANHSHPYTVRKMHEDYIKAGAEIITTNTLPPILNRDMQGRLRRKMLVLKIEKWAAGFLRNQIYDTPLSPDDTLYSIDISSKNPRWRPHEHLED